MIRSYLHYPFWGILSTTVLLLCTHSVIGVTTSTTTAPLSENEFEFDDNDFNLMQKSKVVTTFIDDEDILSDAGSGDEGSGAENLPSKYPDFYRIQFYITYLPSTDGLSDKNSANFRKVSSELNSAISALYNKAVRVSVYKYELREQGAIVSMDLGTKETMNELIVKSLLSTHLKSGQLGNFRVSDDGFTFNALGDTPCPTEVGRKATQLAWTGPNVARLMVNNMFPCDGYVKGWAYYVSRPTETFAATVWRPVDEFKFYLLSKHLLPATQMGYNEFTLSNGVKVEKGDFIGLHYPKSATSGAIAGSSRERSDVPADELYEVYTGELFDDQISVNADFDMKWLNFEKTRASFAIQAIMDYNGIDDNFPERCTENEFKCRDDTCIQKNYYCDGQEDCADGSDEENCGAGCQANEFRCRSGDCVPYSSYCDNRHDCDDGSDEEDCPLCGASEFHCGDGTCLNQMKRCDSHVDCPDASDEYGCESIPCQPGQFRCEGGLCIDGHLKCDGVVNCPDTSDELDCPNRTCSDRQFRCKSGQCIPMNVVCDNKNDCPEGSDELSQACARVCKPDGFRCNDGSCIRKEQKCDRNPDCRDGSDELNCETVCRPGEFRCHNGDCIPETRRCDSRPDCRDATDEFECQCTTGQFRCRNGQCINEAGVCNRRPECQDGSDEEDCPIPACLESEFSCGNGQCIDRRRKCDGHPDCSDRSDESNCTIQACQAHEFQCRNGQCIDTRRKCDGYPDCADRSDEIDCPACRSNQFQCRDGQCIDERKKCDGRPDCHDRSDEEGCPVVTCGPNDYTCGNGECIPSSKRCNRQYDCRDGSDERNCTECRAGQFRCKNGRCIPEDRICDRRNDCSDGSDESDCASCRASEFKCKSGECISVRQKCDGLKHCQDGSDEMGCEITFTISINPGSLRVRTGSRAVFTCDVRGASVQRVEWHRRSGSAIPEGRSSINGHRLVINDIQPNDADDYICTVNINGQSVNATANLGVDLLIPFVVTVTPRVLTVQEGETAKFMCQMSGTYTATLKWTKSQRRALGATATDQEGILMISSVTQEDSGEYVCNAYGDQGRTSGSVQLIVNMIGPGTERPEGPCRRGEATCNNGDCIPNDYRCDGEEDCTDGSDEFQCSEPLPCEPNEFKCRNGQCAMKIWRCDGDNDCGDGSDEENCPTGPPGSMCEMDEFRCIARHQCIPSSYQCDGENDCLDRSDEMGCRPPTIISPPIKDIEVEIGGTFTISCQAIGIPVPLIIWRLNWGNIPTGDRVVTTSKDGHGQLTISNAILEDAGAYTCEAMNNKGSIFALPDAIVIVKRPSGNCPPPVFNAIAASHEECIQCFCFKRTIQCDSSNLKKVWLTMGSHVNLVNRRGDTVPDVKENYIRYDGAKREFRIPNFQFLPTGVYYFSLPYQFLGNRLTSYGGEINYKVFYEMAGIPVPVEEPDVILTGNGISLYHTVSRKITPGREHNIKISFREQEWQKEPKEVIRSDTPAVEEATRDDLMEVLANVTSVMIKATIDSSQTDLRIYGIKMNGGTPQGRGDRTVLVEECDCPTGYDGLSCEKCAKGYHMTSQGRYGSCVSCNCNGRSNDCDPDTGACIDCQGNTGGPRCDICEEGYYGNPLRGIECEPCPCPHTSGPNQFSRRCELGRDGRVKCLDCPEGYTGSQCEICAEGYIGNPRVAGDYCRPLDEACDLRGSRSTDPNPITSRCDCKGNTKGERCDRCIKGSFYLSKHNPEGCISCFCMGVTVHCTSTSRRRTQIGNSFVGDRAGFSLVNMEQTKRIITGFTVNNQQDLVYRNFYAQPKQVYYWSLPDRYLGNKLTAYGGSLRFTISHLPGINNAPTARAADVEIMGNDIMLFYYFKGNLTRDRPTSFEIPLYEHHWKMSNGNWATREYLLMALADLRSVLIKATYTVDTNMATMRDITLDIAEQRVSGQRADAVEQCSCPTGYRGLSCESCDVGYMRTVKGLYLGLCEECNCNGHSSECDPETGKCRNCQHNTEGDHCDRCAPGHYGNATGGSIYDCMKCPCPLTEQPNQFSPTCFMGHDGKATCNACPVGHTGRNCQKCKPGFSGNPLHPGDYCRTTTDGTCDCDSRGTIKNTWCDADTKQCQCKAYVQRLKCDSCKENYFHLSQDNTQGCLSCYCMGITNKCSSSKFYRTKVAPLFATDGSHNFILTNRAMSRTINDGFKVDASREQISFESFTDVQRESESLYFQLPPKFRGDKVTAYGGYLEFTLEIEHVEAHGNPFRETDVEIISSGQRLHYLFNPPAQAGRPNNYKIHLVEKSFNMWDGTQPSREVFMTVLANIDAILIRATYHTMMIRSTLRDVSIEIAVAEPTGQRTAPMVEKCICPEGYAGLSCQECALGYSRIKDEGTGLGRCGRCNCHSHSSTCDPRTGKCLNCKHNTEGARCEICKPGYYGDASVGTSGDCRPCACPLTIQSNNFSPTCYLAHDSKITCDKCQRGYSGRNCDTCAPGFSGNPSEPGSFCRSTGTDNTPRVIVNPINIRETIGNTAVFSCRADSRESATLVWSRVDGRRLPGRAQQNYRNELIIENLTPVDTGRYVCIATNSHGSSKAFVELVVSTFDFQVHIEGPTEKKVDIGSSVRLVCSITGQHSSAYVLSWSKVGGVLPNSALEFDGVLTLENIQEEDAGEYRCTGSAPENVATAIAVIIISSSTSPPDVRIEPRYQSVSAGQPAQFTCTATGSPKPTITWYKDESKPVGNGAVVKDGVLSFAVVTKLHESEYYCVATNSMGTTKVRTVMYVIGDVPTLEIIIRQQSIVTSVGKRIELVCSAQESGQLINLVWSKQDGQLPSGATQRNGVLVIDSAKPSDSGVYICTGTTRTGSSGTNRAVITITTQPVGVRPTARIEPTGLITIAQRTTGTLRCIVTGEPTPTITWSKARGELSRNHKINGNILRITETMVEDRGVYICKASNIAGTVQASAIVEVERRELPRINMYPKTTQTISVGGGALFQCQLTAGIPSPTVTWTREGGEAMSSRVEIIESGAIRFSGVTSEDQGGYICTATNAVGTVTSTAFLIISGPPKIIINQRQVRVKVGDHVRIECAAEGDPAPNVYWEHQQNREYHSIGNAPVEIQSVAVLEINSVGPQDGKYYTCIADNGVGTSRERVELIVERTDIVVPPREKNRLNVNEGENVVVTCETQGFVGSRITWRRRRGPLPPGHSVSGGILTIPRITKDYGGEYVCTTTTLEGTFEASFIIIVSVAPRITISPSNVSARPGEPLRLHCRADGSGPIGIEWMKTNGVISPAVEERNGVLIFKEVTAADAGEYRCIAKSSSGVATGIVLVKVVVQPVVKVTQNEVSVRRGQTVTLECPATGTPRPTIVWEKSGGPLPANHGIKEGVLTIFGFTEEDAGRYICTATNAGGSARDYIYLRFTNIHTPEPIPTATQTTNVGDKVEFDCIVSSTINHNPKMTWSKVEGPISEDAIYGNGVLIIPKVKVGDAGTYVCTLSMDSGEVAETKISLFVKSRPVISIPDNYNSAPLGTPTTLGCTANGTPQPLITWTKENGDLPSEHFIVDGNLYIPKVRPEDAGTYFCSASNAYDTVRHAVTLQVSDLIPNFEQNPVSYIEYPPLKNAYLDFDIIVSFRPSVTDGMILYNGQETENGDFLCFGLRERYPEFRFNVGSGPAVIRGNQTLELDKWHTIQLKRDRREGMMLIDGQPAYTGTAPGRFQGLDLDQSFYLGGVPDYRIIPQSAGFDQGFVGGVSQVQISGKPLDLGGDALNVVGIDQFRVCDASPCYNGGSCVPKNMKYGYSCMCPQGFAGFQCETTGESCFPGACGPTGRCQDLRGLAGFKCVCPIGRLGRGCQEGVTVKDPFFNKTSFISYPPIEDGHKMLTIDILMKPHLLHDGIILYSGQQENGNGDFVALVMKEGGYLEFRYDVGSGPAIIRSAQPVRAKEWINVHLHRDDNMGMMQIESQDPIRVRPGTINNDPFNFRGDSSPGDRVGLNLRLPLYLGGVDPRFTVASGVGSVEGFTGCIGEIEINDRAIHLIKDAVESSDINDCGEKRLCDRMPCKNGGLCEDVSSTEFLCICEPNFSGKRCESKVDICTNNPCQNAGLCTVTNAGYRCDCQLGYIGLNCENSIQLNKKFQLAGNGFVMFSHEMLPHQTIKQTQNISFTITTAESKGLLFWQAVDHGQSIRKNDYLSIYLKDGLVVFSYELGSGPSEISINFTVNDSLPHNIQAIRTGRQGRLIVDGQHFRGRSQGVLQMLNVKGNIFVGGVPDLSAMTGGLHDTNFFGCMNNLFINGNGPLKLSQSAVGGLNVRHCANPHGGRG